MTTKFKQFLLFFMVLLLSAGQVMAQDNRAVISGIVTDETGMGVIGAAIQVKNESTGFNTGSITNENGEYTIKQLPLGGPYSITVTYVGYGDQKKTGYTLNQGDLLRLDFHPCRCWYLCFRYQQLCHDQQHGVRRYTYCFAGYYT